MLTKLTNPHSTELAGAHLTFDRVAHSTTDAFPLRLLNPRQNRFQPSLIRGPQSLIVGSARAHRRTEGT